MTFYIAQYVDDSYDYPCPDEHYFKSKKNAELFIEKNVEKYRADLTSDSRKNEWEHKKKYSNLEKIKEFAQGEQLIIEKYAEQLKELDPSDKKNKGKINQLNQKIKNKEESRDKYLEQIRIKTDFEFYLQSKINHYRKEWSVIEAKFEDE